MSIPELTISFDGRENRLLTDVLSWAESERKSGRLILLGTFLVEFKLPCGNLSILSWRPYGEFNGLLPENQYEVKINLKNYRSYHIFDLYEHIKRDALYLKAEKEDRKAREEAENSETLNDSQFKIFWNGLRDLDMVLTIAMKEINPYRFITCGDYRCVEKIYRDLIELITKTKAAR